MKHGSQSNLGFGMMTREFRLGHLLQPPARILHKTGLVMGMVVLDFGCGRDGFSRATAKLVGPGGSVFLIDMHPLVLDAIMRAARRRKICARFTVKMPGRSPGKMTGSWFVSQSLTMERRVWPLPWRRSLPWL